MPRLPVPFVVGAMLSVLLPCTVLAQPQASGLPDGAGKALVESLCTACHPTTQITRSSGYTLAGWKELGRVPGRCG
jgi:virginiamycin B lyase